MEASQKKYLRIQLAISGLTLLLTPIFSAFVVYLQLSTEHRYWRIHYDATKFDAGAEEKVKSCSQAWAAYWEYMDADKQYDIARVRAIWYQAWVDVANKKKILGLNVVGYRTRRDIHNMWMRADENFERAAETFDAADTQLQTALMKAFYSFSSEVRKNYVDLYTEMIAGETNKKDLDLTIEVLESMRNAIRDYFRTKDVKTLWSRRSDIETNFVNREKRREFHRCMLELLQAMMLETVKKKDDSNKLGMMKNTYAPVYNSAK